jgi:hypothetical protein
MTCWYGEKLFINRMEDCHLNFRQVWGKLLLIDLLGDQAIKNSGNQCRFKYPR